MQVVVNVQLDWARIRRRVAQNTFVRPACQLLARNGRYAFTKISGCAMVRPNVKIWQLNVQVWDIDLKI